MTWILCLEIHHFIVLFSAVLPELPLPTPLNQYGTGSILLHPGLEDSARHLLQTVDHGLAARVAQALQAQPAEFLAPATAAATPTALALPLAQAVQQHYPQVRLHLAERRSHWTFFRMLCSGIWAVPNPGSYLPSAPKQSQHWTGKRYNLSKI